MKGKSGLILMLAAILSVSCMLSMSGCGKNGTVSSGGSETDLYMPSDGKDDSAPGLKLSASSATIELYDTYTLAAELKNIDGEVSWTTSDAGVLKVENGVVTALATGSATVTAKSGEYEAKCEITVKETDAAPVLSLDYPSVQISKGGEFTVTPAITWKGVSLSEAVAYDYTLAEGADGSIASVSVGADGAGIVKGLAEGTTEYYVSATCRGIYVAQKFTVTVRALDIVFDIFNVVPGEGCYEATLYTLDEGGYSSKFVPVLTVYENGKAVENPSVEWATEDTDIAVVSDGAINGEKQGRTLATCSYKGETFGFYCNVYRTPVRLSERVLLETSDLKTVSISETLVGEVESATFKGVSFLGGFSDGVLTLDSAKAPRTIDTLGDGELIVSTNKADYILEASVYTKLISTKSELDGFGAMAGANGASSSEADGYFALENDIVYDGEYSSSLTGIAFKGIFDGRGYNIGGMTVTASGGGLFDVLGGTAVVKNVSFTDARVSGCGFICSSGSGTIENVYVKYIGIGNGAGNGKYTGTFFSNSASVGASVRSCFVDGYEGILLDGAVKNVRLIGSGAGSAAIYSEVYAVSRATAIVGSAVGNASGSDEYKIFKAYTEVKADIDVQSKISGWDGGFWTVGADGCPIPLRLAE